MGGTIFRKTSEGRISRVQAVALEAYRARKLSTEQLRRLLGFETRYGLEGFLKQHQVRLEYSLKDFEREGEASA